MKRLALAVVLLAPNALAVTTSGGNITIAPISGTAPARWPAIAYDGRYLAVSGAGRITGQLLDDDGAALGAPFAVNAGSNLAQAPRVCAANGRFLVTWHETIGSATRVRGRFVGAAPMGDDFDISPLGTNWEMGAGMALLKKELLVAWQNVPRNEIVAQRVSESGMLLGGPITIATGRYHRDPTVVANESELIIAYAGCVADKSCFVEAQRVRDGALVGDRLVLDSSLDAGYVPEAAFNSATGDVLVVWYRVTSTGKEFRARAIHRDGTLGAVIPITATGSYDANGLAYNARSGSFLFVTHGDTSQDVAMELSSSGAPINTVSFGPVSTGNFNPRVAANAIRPEWIAVTATEYKTISAQRFVTEGIATPDAGVVSDASPPASDGGASAHDTRTAELAPTDGAPVEGSCSCAAPRRGPSLHQPGGFLLLAVAVAGRRRARS